MKRETRNKLVKQVSTIAKVQANARRHPPSGTTASESQKERARAALREATRALDEFFGVDRRD